MFAADADVSVPAALIAEPARAAMLVALLDGRCLAAGELARAAGVSASTASEHLARLTAGGLTTVTSSGRHRYYTLRNNGVAQTLESLQTIARPAPPGPLAARRRNRRRARLRPQLLRPPRRSTRPTPGQRTDRTRRARPAGGRPEGSSAQRRTPVARPARGPCLWPHRHEQTPGGPGLPGLDRAPTPPRRPPRRRRSNGLDLQRVAPADREQPSPPPDRSRSTQPQSTPQYRPGHPARCEELAKSAVRPSSKQPT